MYIVWINNQLHFNSCLLILKIAEMLKLQIVIAISCWCNFLKCQKRISILVWPAFSISIVFLELPTIPLFISFEVFKVRVGKKSLKDNFYWDKYVVTSCLLNKRFVNCCENMYKCTKSRAKKPLFMCSCFKGREGGKKLKGQIVG